MAAHSLLERTVAVVPFKAPRSLSVRARLLLWFYRYLLKASLAKRLELARARVLATKLDRLMDRGRRHIERQRVSANGLAADWINPGTASSGRVILYLHGGGFMLRTPRMHARLAARLCQTLEAKALMPEYRLAPEHPLPAAHEDCFAAYLWLLDEGHDPAKIVVIGDSAGGLLVLATLQRIRDAGMPAPAAGVMFSPGTCVDSILELDARSTAGDPMVGAGVLDLLQRVVATTVAPSDAAVSPCAGSLHGLPPLLFQAGSTELLLHHSEKAAAQARSAGTHAELQVWPQMPHVWQAVHWLPEAHQALASVGDFVARHSAAAAQARKVGSDESTALQGGRAKDALLAVADGSTAPQTKISAFPSNRTTKTTTQPIRKRRYGPGKPTKEES